MTAAHQRFAARIALVTGAASGIGFAIAERLAREGARVVIADRDAAAAAAAAQRLGDARALPIAMDIADEASVADGFRAAEAQAGPLDIVVNSAGITGPTATTIADYGVAEFDLVYRVNLRGSFLTARAAVRGMLPRRRGRIVLMASIAGKDGNPGMIGYSATKAGVIGMVKALGKEYAESGITINGIAPAVVRTPLLDQVAPAQVAYMSERIPMKRLGTVDEVAALACWIACDECSFTTGFTFDCSGGRAVY
jgi:NAD(P)-dependent dehydrogenase (short-subunit alcohol dehydrogenase family)